MTCVPYCEHTSQAMAAAVDSCPDIIKELVRAHDNPSPRRLVHLQEAQSLAFAILAAINAAISAETAARPTASPVTSRIREAART